MLVDMLSMSLLSSPESVSRL